MGYTVEASAELTAHRQHAAQTSTWEVLLHT